MDQHSIRCAMPPTFPKLYNLRSPAGRLQFIADRADLVKQGDFKVCNDCGKRHFSLDEFIGHRVKRHNVVREMLLRLNRAR